MSGHDSPLPAGENQLVGDVAGNLVQANHIDAVHLHQPSLRQVNRPWAFGVLPPRAGAFQNRAVADELGQAATTSVVSGLGGVGKTQLAADHARTRWQAGELDVLIWVTAASRSAITSAYADAARLLTGIDDPDSDRGAARLIEWLTSTGERWLVVLDDLQLPADLRGLWPPHTASGHTVVTTRRRDAALLGDGRRFVPVGEYTPAESLNYLRAKLPQHEQLTALAQDLGHLPLALAQAAAYLADNPLITTVAEYRARLADRRRRLADSLPDGQSLPDDHQATVDATWSLSIELADQTAPPGLARPVLEMAAMLDPNGIPVPLFTALSALEHLSAATPDEVRAALACLHRFNLVTIAPDELVRVHALVQRATREHLSDEQHREAAQVAAAALLEIWPEVERDTDLAMILRTNASALHSTAEADLWIPDAHEVLSRMGPGVGGAGSLAAAITYCDLLHATSTLRLGPDHPHTLSARGDLACLRGKIGEPAGAVITFEQLVPDLQRVLGPDNPQTLTARCNLAVSRSEAGDPDQATAELEQVLTDMERALGPDDSHTLTTRNHLAHVRSKAGDLAGAVAAFDQLHTDRLRLQGPDHPETLLTRSHLAHGRALAGDPAGAVTALEQLVPGLQRVLGPDHPQTLSMRRFLAFWRGEADDRTTAITRFEQLLDNLDQVLSPGQPASHHAFTRWKEQTGSGPTSDPDPA
ncbi:tetratricopeptide repeat protein [Crossiella sp. CA-258035]|uniref:tetratricopeptide repeat protein n=1 Tax=Crossiella sp. CA-258035 TaxID=2981138 RepID=UPI0024BD4A47|nr:tetratricopeptide repeat protein [Crossiella sp. CA-258035]WHT23114.1 tetratricopeptide repeat protein [Crossiella sp. CA-258035]